jgi:hypothetical protein
MAVIDLSPEVEHRLGPLARLVGAWEGEKGHDITSAQDATTTKLYRETMSFEPVGPIGPQELYGLRYSTFSWAYGEPEEKPIHQELGFWFWSAADKQVIRCFTNQNGVAINAGGQCESEENSFEMSAEVGSDVYGIASSPFMNNACKTVAYKLKVDIEDDNNFRYSEETCLRAEGQQESIIHKDENSLTKVY